MNKIKIIVCGAAGKMGLSILRLAKADIGLEIAGAVEGKNHTAVGTGEPPICDDIFKIINSCNAVIDFTTPSAAIEHLAYAEKNNKAMVIGTTGLSPEQESKIKNAGKKIPIVFSPNMSIGVNILFMLVGKTAKAAGNYDVEIVELHHNQKKDAPSGTAVKLLSIISDSLGRNPKDAAVYGREGVIGARKKEEIGVLAVRAGDIVGEHTVYFAGPGERIELTHRAHSRDTFATGALTAAKWVVHQKPGVYDMQDVLGLR